MVVPGAFSKISTPSPRRHGNVPQPELVGVFSYILGTHEILQQANCPFFVLGLQKSRQDHSAAHYFSIDIVGTIVYLGNTTATDQIEQATAQSGESFEILSATAMWCDRAIAWDALADSTRDEIHFIQAFYKHQAKIDTHIALKILNKEGVAKRLHKKIKKREDLKKLSDFLSS